MSRITDLMVISMNWPPVAGFNVRKYVISWLRSGRRSALDKRTGNAPNIAAARFKLITRLWTAITRFKPLHHELFWSLVFGF